MIDRNIKQLYHKLNDAIEKYDAKEFTKIAEELFWLEESDLEGYNRITKLFEEMIYCDKIKLVSNFIKVSKIQIDMEVLFNQIDRKQAWIFNIIKTKMKIDLQDFGYANDYLIDAGSYIYKSYKKLWIKPQWKCLTPDHFETILNIIFNLSELIMVKRLSHVANCKYTYEMFEHTNYLKNHEKIAFDKAAEITSKKFGIDTLNVDSYLRRLRNYNNTKIIPSQNRK